MTCFLYHFLKKVASTKDHDEQTVFRFFYIKNKSIGEARKMLPKSELHPEAIARNHFGQLYHGNLIKTCMFLSWHGFKSSRYILTGSEDTLVILSRLDDDNTKNKLAHQFYLQGHDSVVKCMDMCEMTTTTSDGESKELILVSAGGKANIKLWRVVVEDEVVRKVTNLYEFKRLRARKNASRGEKPWLYIDLKSNPDIRFMDVRIFPSSAPGEFMLAFACSDGQLRIFRYLVDSNKLDLLSKHPYPKCLLCLDMIRFADDELPVLVGFGTDGAFLSWKCLLDGEEPPRVVYEHLHQSGVNSFDLWRISETAPESTSLLMVSVGDDSRINVLGFDVDVNEGLKINLEPFGLDMAHSSSITGFEMCSKIFKRIIFCFQLNNFL